VTKIGGVKKIGPIQCRPAPLLDENVLIPDGSLMLCCNDYGLRHVLGNLSTQTWAEIHAGEQIAAVRESMRAGDCLCRTCEFAV
jgi:hypothetical protein